MWTCKINLSGVVVWRVRERTDMEKQTMKETRSMTGPYERCIKQGPEALSDEELLSVIIRTGSRKANSLETARQILRLNYPQDGILDYAT